LISPQSFSTTVMFNLQALGWQFDRRALNGEL
jgi:hypothetical protein